MRDPGVTGKGVTAVVVNYNGGATLRDLVASLAEAPALDGIVIVDNASSDTSLDFLERDEFPGAGIRLFSSSTPIAAWMLARCRVSSQY